MLAHRLAVGPHGGGEGGPLGEGAGKQVGVDPGGPGLEPFQPRAPGQHMGRDVAQDDGGPGNLVQGGGLTGEGQLGSGAEDLVLVGGGGQEGGALGVGEGEEV